GGHVLQRCRRAPPAGVGGRPGQPATGAGERHPGPGGQRKAAPAGDEADRRPRRLGTPLGDRRPTRRLGCPTRGPAFEERGRQARKGSAASGSMPNRWMAVATSERSTEPSAASADSTATTTWAASTSKYRRRASRASERPNPSVPSEVNGRGTQRAIWSGTARM